MTTTTTPSTAVPRNIVYQNPDFVSGMLQEMFQVGLLESLEEDNSATTTTSDNTDRTGGGTGSIGISFPAVLKAELTGNGEWVNHTGNDDERASAARKRYVYSQAFYLDVVRRRLSDHRHIKNLPDVDAETVRAGDIVEFTASFRPNEVNALLDIATPELVGEIARFAARTRTTAEIRAQLELAQGSDVAVPVERIAAQRALGEGKASDQAAIATAVAKALKVDTRNESSKEFHASITGDLAAVVMCDSAHFVTADPDRLLDGQFTVLAKVIKGLTASTPILSKNKLLHRIHPDAVAELLTKLVESDDTENPASNFVDLTFPFEIANAITVMPIAIYI